MKDATLNDMKDTGVSRVPPSRRPRQGQDLEEELRLGVRLKRARLLKGMRLRDLAAAGACSESLISKIENNKVTPSLNTVHRLARALGTTVAVLLGDREGVHGVVMRRGERPWLSQFGLSGVEVDGTETELLIPFGADSMLQAMLIRIRPGARGDGPREHKGDEMGYVVAGEIELTVGGETHHLRAGDACFFPSTRPHAIANPGTTIAEIVWVNTPPSL
jgi:transcriptional regulator with XRE-family HTH domain